MTRLSSTSTTRLARASASSLGTDPGETLGTAYAMGTLSSKQSFKDAVNNDDPVDYFRFDLNASETVSVFLSGLSAGNTVDLLNSNGSTLRSSTNAGTTWNASNSIRTGGSVTATLAAGTYYVRVTPAAITGNPLYAKPGYTINFQPHNTPNTVTVAASNSANASTADYIATGSSDQTVINRAIAEMGNRGGGTVLLMEGTFNISNNVLITYDNITLSGVGWSTVLQLQNGSNLRDAGLLRSAYRSESDNMRKPRFSNQHFMHMSLDGNKDGGTDYADSYGNYGTYIDSSFEDLRVHDFPHYGFDPHENYYTGTSTVRLTIANSLSDHNAVDGLTTDDCQDSTFTGNILDSNGRHGINIVTATSNSLFEDNISTNNGSTGITVQPGSSDLSQVPDGNILRNNIVQSNVRSGIYVYRSRNTQITGNTIENNGYHGIQIRSSVFSTVSDNLIDNNGQFANDKYYGVYLDNDGTVFSTNNLVENNIIRSTASIRYRNGIIERSSQDDYNIYRSNTISGTVRAAIVLRGPNSEIQ
jgi:parallel beta-helix repeat protein